MTLLTGQPVNNHVLQIPLWMPLYVQSNNSLLLIDLSFYTQEIIVLAILYWDSIPIVSINYIAFVSNYSVVTSMCSSHIFCSFPQKVNHFQSSPEKMVRWLADVAFLEKCRAITSTPFFNGSSRILSMLISLYFLPMYFDLNESFNIKDVNSDMGD